MKKIILILIFVLFLTSCGTTSLTGNYYSSDETFLKLYNNGTCDWKWGTDFGQYTDECKYDFNDNEIIITYTSLSLWSDSDTFTCVYNKNVIDCNYRDVYTKTK